MAHRNHCPQCLWSAHVNPVAGDDDPFVLLSLAARPMAHPPFPVERIPK
jgi:hypothetical protein